MKDSTRLFKRPSLSAPTVLRTLKAMKVDLETFTTIYMALGGRASGGHGSRGSSTEPSSTYVVVGKVKIKKR